MRNRPLVLVSPSVSIKGAEFADVSMSLSAPYERALLEAGALPWPVMSLETRAEVANCVDRADGILLTGGEDIEPRLYAPDISPKLRKKSVVTPDQGARDWRELLILDEVFRQRKPLLAICRGHQLLNIALGGTLYVDLKTEKPEAMNHQRMDRRSLKVHDVRLTPGGLLAKITQRQTLGVNSTHHQAVKRRADVLKVAAASADGIVESMELESAAAYMLPFLLSVQFHPERLARRHREHHAIFAAFTKACAAQAKNNL